MDIFIKIFTEHFIILHICKYTSEPPSPFSKVAFFSTNAEHNFKPGERESIYLASSFQGNLGGFPTHL